MKRIYTLTVHKQLPSKTVLEKDLLNFQLRTGFSIKKALELYTRPMTWEFTNKRDAQKALRQFNNDGTGRVATLK